MNGLDLVIALILLRPGDWTYEKLARAARVSSSQAHASVRRLRTARLMPANSWRPLRRGLAEFIVHGLPYAFPARQGAPSLGVPTAWGVESVASQLGAGGEDAPVWPSATGSRRGPSVAPLHRAVPVLARQDGELHELLALIDCLRLGRARERRLAAAELEARLAARA